ncbi:MAG: integrase core domain-containing protein [Methylomonas sp.]|nr:integrase core domain-containing protein [Methylomonas sp.]
MSRKGNGWDNAVMERFFLNLKMERVWHRQYANHNEAMRDVTDDIVNFYNRRRLHSSLAYLSPNDYEMKRADQQPNFCVRKKLTTTKYPAQVPKGRERDRESHQRPSIAAKCLLRKNCAHGLEGGENLEGFFPTPIETVSRLVLILRPPGGCP